MSPEPTPPAAPPVRLSSIDAYRGFVMFLMMAEVLAFWRLAQAYPDNPLWQLLSRHQSHVEWLGCSLHDLIQPSFSFLVGMALPFSIAARQLRGHGTTRLFGHALWRSLILVVLGIFLRSVGNPQTHFTFEDTLTQIGLGYPFLFLLGTQSPRVQGWATGLILFGYWAAFALYPLAGPGFDAAAVGVDAAWQKEHWLAGFAGHWNKNANLAWAFDQWFLNLFPREHPFTFNGGGYATLSFIPTLATMTLGLIVGGWLRSGYPERYKLRRLALAGLIGLALGWLLDWSQLCPGVKRIWTPGWTLYSGGWCFLLFAGFYLVMDVLGFKAWAFPLRVIGLNSIAAYCMAHLMDGFLRRSFITHLGEDFFLRFGAAYAETFRGAMVLLVFWLILFWMYRRKIFLKI